MSSISALLPRGSRLHRTAIATMATVALTAVSAYAWISLSPAVFAPTSLNVNGTASYEATASIANNVYWEDAVFEFPANTDLSGVDRTTITADLGGHAIAVNVGDLVVSGNKLTVTLHSKRAGTNVARIAVGGVRNASQPGDYSYTVTMRDASASPTITATHNFTLAANSSAVTLGKVALSNEFIGQPTGFTIPITVGSSGRLAANASAGANTITVDFPAEFDLPATAPAGSVLVNGVAATSVQVSGQALTVAVPAGVDVANGGTASLVLTSDFGFANPASPGSFDLSVSTSAETGTATKSFSVFEEVSAVATASGKVYDGTVAASAEVTVTGIEPGDDVAVGTVTARFDSKTVGVDKTVTVTGVALTGADAWKYALASAEVTASASISQKSLTATAAANNKTYDASTTATARVSSTDVIAGDTVTFTGFAAAFSDKNVGVGKTVTVSGIALAGIDSANYALVSPVASTTADISAKQLSITPTPQNKVYDGSTSATVSYDVVGVLGADVVTLSETATFDTKDVGVGKPVTISGITLGGADGGNYSLASDSASGAADVTLRPLTITADDIIKVQATSYVFAGTEFTTDGLVEGDSVDSAALASDGATTTAAIGNFEIAISDASGTGLSNYEVTYVAGTMRVRAGAVSLTVGATQYAVPYHGSVMVTTRLLDALAAPLAGRHLTVETSLDGVHWGASVDMTDVAGVPGTYQAPVSALAATGVTQVRIVSADDGVNPSGEASTTLLPQAGFTTPKVTRVSNHYRYVSGSVSPAHAAKIYFEIQRYSSSKRKWIGVSKTSYTTGSSGTFKVKKYFSSRGWMRVRITHADAGHAFGTSAWKKVWIN